ncbi:hypothetical protein BS47DRAFT_1402460 [Hydnum rufescens UP504]|uniref:Uncharacterized protein n=1 Tax=Hydnum rufescens UP504 TaxID=1448309 RepID=A0A9P6ADW0_9AGAM|nr:hypothetical protein BS47DRAFT_1402460 [Hydnum rufescens UP504]
MENFSRSSERRHDVRIHDLKRDDPPLHIHLIDLLRFFASRDDLKANLDQLAQQLVRSPVPSRDLHICKKKPDKRNSPCTIQQVKHTPCLSYRLSVWAQIGLLTDRISADWIRRSSDGLGSGSPIGQASIRGW